MPLRNPGLHHMDLGPNGQEMLKECREVWNGWTTWIVFVEDEEEGYRKTQLSYRHRAPR